MNGTFHRRTELQLVEGRGGGCVAPRVDGAPAPCGERGTASAPSLHTLEPALLLQKLHCASPACICSALPGYLP